MGTKTKDIFLIGESQYHGFDLGENEGLAKLHVHKFLKLKCKDFRGKFYHNIKDYAVS